MDQNLSSDNALTLFLHDEVGVATPLKVVAHDSSELEVDPLREVVGYPYSKSACNVNEMSKIVWVYTLFYECKRMGLV